MSYCRLGAAESVVDPAVEEGTYSRLSCGGSWLWMGDAVYCGS